MNTVFVARLDWVTQQCDRRISVQHVRSHPPPAIFPNTRTIKKQYLYFFCPCGAAQEGAAWPNLCRQCSTLYMGWPAVHALFTCGSC